MPCFCLKVQKILPAALPAVCFPSLGVFPMSVSLVSHAYPILGVLKPAKGCSLHPSLLLEKMSPRARLCPLPCVTATSSTTGLVGKTKLSVDNISTRSGIFRCLQLATCSEGLKGCVSDEERFPIYSSRSLQNYFAFGYYLRAGVTYDTYTQCYMDAI